MPSASEAWSRQATNLSPPNKKGGGAPIGAIQPGSASSLMRRRALFPSPPPLAGEVRRGTPAFRRSTAVSPRFSHPGSARAALPGITGSKREDPLRHQCSEHLAVRSRAGRDDAQAARKRFAKPRAGTALAPLSGSHLESALHRARLFISGTVTNVNRKVSMICWSGQSPRRRLSPPASGCLRAT